MGIRGLQVIYLDQDEDIVSIRDRLDWAKEQQVVLVLPDTADLLTEYLDLAMLRRHADALRLEVGLVTADGWVAGQAEALGFPTFLSVRAARQNQQGWWRGRRRPERVGKPTHLDRADRREVKRRLSSRPAWQRWLLRYAAIVLFFLTLATLFVAAAYAIPGATVTLKPEVRPLLVSREIVADPNLEAVDFDQAAVPGRLLLATQEWRADVATSGTIEVPDAPARGTVVFVNRLEQPVNVPAGTRVSTTAGTRVIFQTLDPVEVPGVVGGTAEVDVVAIQPGPGGNVEANLVNRVEGSLSLQLQVRNLEPVTGGGVRLSPAVTESDQERLRAQVLQQLQVLALAEMEGQLAGQEFLARDSLQVVSVLHETFSHFPGEQTDRLALEIRAELQATAVDETQATGLVYEKLAAAVRPGFELVPGSLQFHSGEVMAVDSEGRVTFEMIGEGQMAAQLNAETPIEEVAGQKTEVALAYLYRELPLREYPRVSVWPNWFGRMPYLPVRIEARVETE